VLLMCHRWMDEEPRRPVFLSSPLLSSPLLSSPLLSSPLPLSA
jgi:hypothetical protein